MFKIETMKMRKISITLLSLLVSVGVMAEGYQINLSSSKQLGMGHIGASMKLGAESMIFNPAGLAFMTSTNEVTLGGNAIFSKVSYKNGSTTAESDNPVSPPIYGYYGRKLGENLAVGVSINNPAGNGLYWGDTWAGASLVQHISLKAFSVQPTISYKFWDKLSIGAGLTINFGEFELAKALIPAGGLAGLASAVPSLAPVINYYAAKPAASLVLSGKSEYSYGFNVGILYDVTDQITVGASYRSKVDLSVAEGEADVNYPGPVMRNVIQTAATAMPSTFKPIIWLENASFSASLPIPANLNVGVTYKPTDYFTLAAEVNYTQWSVYEKLDIVFDNELLGTSTLTKNFKNSFTYRLGTEIAASEKLQVRFGVIYDMTPVDLTKYSPETPGANKLSLTAGLTYAPCEKIEYNLGFQYLNGAHTSGSVPVSPTATFSGTYKTIAYIPSFGVSFKF